MAANYASDAFPWHAPKRSSTGSSRAPLTSRRPSKKKAQIAAATTAVPAAPGVAASQPTAAAGDDAAAAVAASAYASGSEPLQSPENPALALPRIVRGGVVVRPPAPPRLVVAPATNGSSQVPRPNHVMLQTGLAPGTRSAGAALRDYAEGLSGVFSQQFRPAMVAPRAAGVGAVGGSSSSRSRHVADGNPFNHIFKDRRDALSRDALKSAVAKPQIELTVDVTAADREGKTAAPRQRVNGVDPRSKLPAPFSQHATGLAIANNPSRRSKLPSPFRRPHEPSGARASEWGAQPLTGPLSRVLPAPGRAGAVGGAPGRRSPTPFPELIPEATPVLLNERTPSPNPSPNRAQGGSPTMVHSGARQSPPPALPRGTPMRLESEALGVKPWPSQGTSSGPQRRSPSPSMRWTSFDDGGGGDMEGVLIEGTANVFVAHKPQPPPPAAEAQHTTKPAAETAAVVVAFRDATSDEATAELASKSTDVGAPDVEDATVAPAPAATAVADAEAPAMHGASATLTIDETAAGGAGAGAVTAPSQTSSAVQPASACSKFATFDSTETERTIDFPLVEATEHTKIDEVSEPKHVPGNPWGVQGNTPERPLTEVTAAWAEEVDTSQMPEENYLPIGNPWGIESGQTPTLEGEGKARPPVTEDVVVELFTAPEEGAAVAQGSDEPHEGKMGVAVARGPDTAESAPAAVQVGGAARMPEAAQANEEAQAVQMTQEVLAAEKPQAAEAPKVVMATQKAKAGEVPQASEVADALQASELYWAAQTAESVQAPQVAEAAQTPEVAEEAQAPQIAEVVQAPVVAEAEQAPEVVETAHTAEAVSAPTVAETSQTAEPAQASEVGNTTQTAEAAQSLEATEIAEAVQAPEVAVVVAQSTETAQMATGAVEAEPVALVPHPIGVSATVEAAEATAAPPIVVASIDSTPVADDRPAVAPGSTLVSPSAGSWDPSSIDALLEEALPERPKATLQQQADSTLMLLRCDWKGDAPIESAGQCVTRGLQLLFELEAVAKRQGVLQGTLFQALLAQHALVERERAQATADAEGVSEEGADEEDPATNLEAARLMQRSQQGSRPVDAASTIFSSMDASTAESLMLGAIELRLALRIKVEDDADLLTARRAFGECGYFLQQLVSESKTRTLHPVALLRQLELGQG